MRVLLTGASGFVGSHILDRLVGCGIPTSVLLRPTSGRGFLARHLPAVEVRTGSISDPASLRAALAGISHVIHCAGCTKAVKVAEFYATNQRGTRQIVEAVNAQAGHIERFVHISSLAVTGPATPAQPACESDPPHPVSEYGRSKLAAELEVRDHCRADYVIVRPPAIYGPRDRAFLTMFRAVQHHLRPQPSRAQALSLVFAPDLAAVVVTCLQHAAAAGKTYFVAAREVVSGRLLADEIAAQIGHWTVACPLPAAALWPACAVQEIVARLTRKARLLNLQKFAELRAPGWVCDASLVRRELGCECATSLKQGVAQSLAWYRENGWL